MSDASWMQYVKKITTSDTLLGVHFIYSQIFLAVVTTEHDGCTKHNLAVSQNCSIIAVTAKRNVY